jgi:hypothetical protein
MSDLRRFYQGISYTSKETDAISSLDAPRVARIRGRSHETENMPHSLKIKKIVLPVRWQIALNLRLNWLTGAAFMLYS